jgi:hypothetical protein
MKKIAVLMLALAGLISYAVANGSKDQKLTGAGTLKIVRL